MHIAPLPPGSPWLLWKCKYPQRKEIKMQENCANLAPTQKNNLWLLIWQKENGPRPKSLLEGGQTGTFQRPKKPLNFEHQVDHEDLPQHPQTIHQSKDLVEIFPMVYNMLISWWEEERSQLIKNTLKNRAQTNHRTLTIDSATKTENKGRELYITRKLFKRSF